MKLLKNILLAISLTLLPINAGAIATAGALSHDGQTPASIVADSHGDACNGLSQVGGACGSGQGSIGKVVAAIINIISYIAGAIAIIMIIVSGVRFITSDGDSNKVASARSALIYALIGVAVTALAQVFVHFVLNVSSNNI